MGAVGRLREGARSELRRQLREVERWRRATLVVVVLLVVAAVPGFFMLRAATRDPAFNSLDTLNLPSWAAASPTDAVVGSRWCIRECRFRQRTLTSERGPDETAQVYERVLQDAGWNRWKVLVGCPDNPVPGKYSCWKRDEYTLDLWVRDPPCVSDPLRNRPTVAAPKVTPSAPVAAGPPADDCKGSVVTIKVRNGIADNRGRGGSAPRPTQENPDIVIPESILPTTPGR